MTPRDLKSAREALGLSQAGFARLLGLDGADAARTVRKWELGERLAPPTVWTILHLIETVPAARRSLERRAGL